MKGTAREERGQKGYEKPMIRVATHQAYEMNAAYQQMIGSALLRREAKGWRNQPSAYSNTNSV